MYQMRLNPVKRDSVSLVSKYISLGILSLRQFHEQSNHAKVMKLKFKEGGGNRFCKILGA